MKKYFVVSDVHGFYNELMAALDKAAFDINNPDHILISCGDLLDRGPDARKCLQFICKLIDLNRAICIMGNHEQLMVEAIQRGYFLEHDSQNKTDKTAMQLYETQENYIPSDFVSSEGKVLQAVLNDPDWQKYRDHWQYYYETEKYIFVHGWIPCIYDIFGRVDKDKYIYNPNWRNSSDEDWHEALWFNPYEAWYAGITENNKTIVCGHWSTSYGHSKYHHKGFDNIKNVIYMLTVEELKLWKSSNEGKLSIINKYMYHDIFKDKGIVGLDATTALSHQVNCFTISKGMKKI